ncbi:MAG: FlgO family outer membrane protein, partial [Campylobacterota bacterium]|nr:FlgO family outer membrane protein [Campylobacterota bacterium]
DFRGQDAVLVNEDGEFHITRDTEKLRDIINGIEFILVGTYVKFENQSLLINARIIDSISGEVISSGRSVYKPKDCQIFGICKNIETQKDILDKQQNHLYHTSDYTDTNSDSKYDEELSIMPDTKKSK